mmetsp:Transcript_11649/g.36314  ORF Transcript_11649/g.36314 Transcript_11649/m.36314 type:complete len:251 (+) Transcript_11649:296-1048(+)
MEETCLSQVVDAKTPLAHRPAEQGNPARKLTRGGPTMQLGDEHGLPSEHQVPRKGVFCGGRVHCYLHRRVAVLDDGQDEVEQEEEHHTHVSDEINNEDVAGLRPVEGVLAHEEVEERPEARREVLELRPLGAEGDHAHEAEHEEEHERDDGEVEQRVEGVAQRARDHLHARVAVQHGHHLHHEDEHQHRRGAPQVLHDPHLVRDHLRGAEEEVHLIVQGRARVAPGDDRELVHEALDAVARLRDPHVGDD